jgi:hypothetical protein
MNRSRFSFVSAVIFATVVLSLRIDPAAAQEVGLTPIEATETEVARGYRAETFKLKPVVNEKNETLGRINDFIFGKDGNIYVVLAVGDFGGLGNHLVAIPFRSLKLEDPPVSEPARLEARFGARNYTPLLVTIVRGEGVHVRDESGRRYIDMMGAYSAVSFGHWV